MKKEYDNKESENAITDLDLKQMKDKTESSSSNLLLSTFYSQSLQCDDVELTMHVHVQVNQDKNRS